VDLDLADQASDSLTVDVPVVFPESTAPQEAAAADDLQGILSCPVCCGELQREDEHLCCLRDGCRAEFPMVDGIPVLVNEKQSLFDLSVFLDKQPTFFKPTGWLRRQVSRLIPNLDDNVTARRNFERLRELLPAQTARPKVLVLGGSVAGAGMESLIDDPRIQLIETDVAIGPRAQIICDAHDLPFRSGVMDAVIVQAVLEHVLDPQRCVAEIWRVLRPDGLVYSDIPFMQQVHGREFDFQRFTWLGHRRLFRAFRELDGGITCGPGMALAWSARYFALSFFRHPKLRALVSGLARLSLFWLKYFDRWLVHRPSAFDAASAFYFLGRKSDAVLSDRDLIAAYRGGF
jgi:SAM-dependent methyltransferase/uncharacterized protein YbaR (Trm112 family)